MRPALLLLFLTLVLAQPVAAQSQSGLRLVVLDTQDRPLEGVAITLETEGGSRKLTTDAAGVAVAAKLVGTAFGLINARLSNGAALAIEGTTLDDGLRLGLVPGQQRTVLLRVDSGLLFVDPETVFAGPAVPPTVATMQTVLAPPSGEMAQVGERASPASAPPQDAPQREAHPAPPSAEYPRWQIALVLLLLVALPLVVLGVRAFARTQGRRS